MKLYLLILLLSGCVTPLSVQVDRIKNRTTLDTTEDKNSMTVDYATHKRVESVEKDLVEQKTKSDALEVKRLVNLAEIYVLKREYDKARNIVSEILKIDLKNKDAKLISAGIYFREKRYDMVPLILNTLGGEGSSESAALNLLALVALEKKDYSKAMQLFQTALRINPSDTSARMNLGILFLKYRQLKEAAISFERILKSTPNNPDAMLHLAIVDTHRGRYEQAEIALKELLKTNNPIVSLNYAFLLLKQKRLEEALSRFNDYVNHTSSRDNDTNREKVQNLITEIERTLQSQKNKLDDQEIEKMAANFDGVESKKGHESSDTSSGFKVGETVDSPSETTKKGTAEKPEPVSPKSKEIDSLEKELLE